MNGVLHLEENCPTPTHADVQGTADISNIRVNGTLEVPLVGPPTSKDECKKGGWQQFNNPSFKNQGDCASFVASHGEKQHNK